jgi:hypothetical protein
MAWECAECNAAKMKFVCHHCGKPLCASHALVVVDDAFSDRQGPVRGKAAHCPDCKQQHHQKAAVVSQASA